MLELPSHLRDRLKEEPGTRTEGGKVVCGSVPEGMEGKFHEHPSPP